MANTFNMKDLSNAVAEEFEMTKQSGADVVAFIFDSIKRELADGKQVRLHKFGTLQARSRAAGRARNPLTGESIAIPARRVVKLTASPALKDQLVG